MAADSEIKHGAPAVPFNFNNLTVLVAAAVSFGTFCVSAAQLGVNYIVKLKEAEVAQTNKTKEIELAKEQRERDLATAWQRDFYAYMKENYQFIFDPNSADGSAKRRMLLATFPADIIAQLRNSLSPSSAEEVELLEIASPTTRPASAATSVASPPQPSPRPAGNNDEATVYMQYLQAADADLANQVLTALGNEKFKTPGKQLVNTSGSEKAEIRYYRTEDRQTAERIGKVVQSVVTGTPTIRSLEGRYKHLPRNTFEVWLPKVATSAEAVKVKAPGPNAERPARGQQAGPQ
jgi:hypothetical protein